jgi:hypothetical protein
MKLRGIGLRFDINTLVTAMPVERITSKILIYYSGAMLIIGFVFLFQCFNVFNIF